MAFLDAALSQQQFGVTERVADVFRAAAVSAGERYAEGDISLYELRRIQVERARYETLLVEADVDVGARQQALALMVAAPNDAPRLAAEALPSEMPPALPLAGLDGQAVARRPEVAATRAAFEEQEARARLARAERIAAPTVTGGFKRQSDGLRGAFIGLSVPVPLFDRNRGAVDAARAGAQGAEHRLALAEREVEADALRAMEAYSALRRRAGLLTEDQDPAGNAAVDLLGIALVAYDAGDMDLIELLDAAEALHQARTAQGRLVAQLWIAYFDLERALGGFEDAPFTEDDQ
jgi:cobalt-zinc-cadmium efflux system outer membrane protein